MVFVTIETDDGRLSDHMIYGVCDTMRLLPMLSWAAALATTRTAKRFSSSTTSISTARRLASLSSSSSHGDPINCNLLLSILDDDDRNDNNNPSAPASLRNDFFALRHGQSEANVAGLIASDPAVACYKYGLSATGQQQAQKAAQEIIRTAFAGSIERGGGGGSSKKYSGIAVISSDLLRAKETAEFAVQGIQNLDDDDRLVLHTGGLILDTRLRERGFGTWDGTADSNYPRVWKDDALDSSHTVNGVENVDSVMRRATELVVEYDQKLENHMIVLTAHGDVLQILQTAFMKLPGTQHRTVEHLETATLRRLNQQTPD